jgi:hypothetical protein
VNKQASITLTDDLTNDVTSELTECENRQKKELERLTKAHPVTTEKVEESYRTVTQKAEQLAEEQRLEIAQLKE